LHSFEQDDETMFFAVQPAGDERVVFIARDLNRLVTGMNVADGKSPSLASAPKSEAASAAPGSGSVFFAAIDNMSWIHAGKNDPAATMLRNSQGFTIDLGEADGEDYADLSLLVGSADDATNVVDMLKGFMAMGRIFASQEPELAELGRMINSVSVDAKGNRVRAKIRQDTDNLLHALQDAAALHERHHGDDHEDHDDHHHDHGKHERH
jgi:hypothetical protein